MVPSDFTLPTEDEFNDGDTNQDGILTWAEYQAMHD